MTSENCQQHCQQKGSERVKIGYVQLSKVRFEFQVKAPDCKNELSANALVLRAQRRRVKSRDGSPSTKFA